MTIGGYCMTEIRFMTTLKSLLSIIFIAGITLLSGCNNKKNLNPGFLEGIISIGPICPVERIPPDPACLPTAETYKAYPVEVYSANGGTKILQLMPALDGTFTSELPPGNYLVKLTSTQNNIGGSNLPVEISITSQEKTLLDINIDTGIR
jgi:hypothetical protein